MDYKKLSLILRLNALSCLSFGSLFMIKSEATSLFLSGDPQYGLLVLIVGVGLFLNGLHLVFVASMKNPPKHQVDYFIGGDVLWVVATVALNLASYVIETNGGQWASLAVALLVGSFAWLQFKESRRIWMS